MPALFHAGLLASRSELSTVVIQIQRLIDRTGHFDVFPWAVGDLTCGSIQNIDAVNLKTMKTNLRDKWWCKNISNIQKQFVVIIILLHESLTLHNWQYIIIFFFFNAPPRADSLDCAQPISR